MGWGWAGAGARARDRARVKVGAVAVARAGARARAGTGARARVRARARTGAWAGARVRASLLGHVDRVRTVPALGGQEGAVLAVELDVIAQVALVLLGRLQREHPLPISPYISLYLPVSPCISAACSESTLSLYLPISPCISLHLPISRPPAARAPSPAASGCAAGDARPPAPG